MKLQLCERKDLDPCNLLMRGPRRVLVHGIGVRRDAISELEEPKKERVQK